LHKRAILVDLPKPAGKFAVPLTTCSPFLGFTFNLMHISTDSEIVLKV